MAFLTMQGFFRTFGIICTNFDSAFRLATFFIPNMILYAGYMIPVSEMKRWLFWIVSAIRLFRTETSLMPYSVLHQPCGVWYVLYNRREARSSVNHLSPAWVGAMENEFMRINFTCDGTAIVPRNPPGVNKYPYVL